MSLYFEYPMKGGKKLLQNLTLSHPIYPIVATGWGSMEVIIFTGEGTRIGRISRSSLPTVLAWHPIHKKLVIGWEDGDITLWSENDEVQPLVCECHTNSVICSMAWSNRGLYLVIASANKIVSLWEMNDNIPEISWNVESEVPITNIVHLNSNNNSDSNNFSSLIDGNQRDAVVNKDKYLSFSDSLSFALYGAHQIIWGLDESRTFHVLISASSEARFASMLWISEKRQLISITTANFLDIYHLDSELQSKRLLGRKISVSQKAVSTETKMVHAGSGLIALCCGDDRLRMFSIPHEVIYMVPLPIRGHQIRSISTHNRRQLVSLGTEEGEVMVFSFKGVSESCEAEDWGLVSFINLNHPVTSLQFLCNGDMIIKQGDSTFLLQETIRKRHWDGNAAITQASPDVVVIENTDGCHCILQSNIKISQVALSFPYVGVWNGEVIEIYMVDEATSKSSLVTTFECTNGAFVLVPEGILYCSDSRVLLVDYSCNPISQMAFTEIEGTPMLLDVMNSYVLAVSNKNVIRIAKIKKDELSRIGPPRQLPLPEDQDSIKIKYARINGQGKKLAFITTKGTAERPDSKLWLYDTDSDHLSFYDFEQHHVYPEVVYWNLPEMEGGTMGELEFYLLVCETKVSRGEPLFDDQFGDLNAEEKAPDPQRTSEEIKKNAQSESDKNNQVEAEAPETPSPSTEIKKNDLPENTSQVASKRVILQGKRRGDSTIHDMVEKGASKPSIKDTSPNYLATLFCTQKGIILQNAIPVDSNHVCLVGLTIPEFIVVVHEKDGSITNPDNLFIEQKRLRDFEGLESESDIEVREALLKFSYFAAVGDMDEAYRAVKAIKNPLVWENLARLCVTSGRLDVAEVCLATSKNYVAAKTLEDSKNKPKEVRLALLAAALGMKKEALRILRKNKFYELVTDVLMACGKFKEASKHAEKHDRLRYSALLYKYARIKEFEGDIDNALAFYEKANCEKTDFPRLLFEEGVDELREMMENETDPELLGWWARYLEKVNDNKGALRYYNLAGDFYNCIRLLCQGSHSHLERAVDVLKKKGNLFDPGAAYPIGKRYEKDGDLNNALHYYKMAGAYGRAVQLAKKQEMYSEVVTICLLSENKKMQMEGGTYFIERQLYDKASQLYEKAGDLHRAIGACTAGGLYEELHRISELLSDKAVDSGVFKQMAEHFIHQENYKKAVDMYVCAKAYDDALQLCSEHNVKLTEKMADVMTTSLGNDSQNEEERNQLIQRIAQIAKEQESWHLASKKYTQLGNLVQSMKMLLRAGDTEKVIFFANHSRITEIYILAANYLQSQNWQEDSSIFQHICTFYKKAKAYDNLIAFYEACTQIQIDDNHNYNSALTMLQEALKIAKNLDPDSAKATQLKRRAEILESFIGAREELKKKTPSPDAVHICMKLIVASRENQEHASLINNTLCVGDIFECLINHYNILGEYNDIYKLLQKMQEYNLEIAKFIDMAIIRKTCEKKGASITHFVSTTTLNNATVPINTLEEFVEEEI